MNFEDRAICQCAAWGERVRIGLGAETADLLGGDYEVVRDRNPWLHLARCRACGQPWYLAVDTVDDDYYFRRLTPGEVAAIEARDEWPADYDLFVNVWPARAGESFRARLHWPWQGEDFERR